MLTDSYGYSSDAKGRLISVREGVNPKSLTYDENDHPIILASGESQTHRRYNWFGEVASASTDGNTPELRYGYDALGIWRQNSKRDALYGIFIFDCRQYNAKSNAIRKDRKLYLYTK